MTTTFFQEIRHAVRMLARTPGFTAVAALWLALGIGANSAMFSLHDALLFRPLPVPDAGAVVTLTADSPDQPVGGRLSYSNYRDLRDQTRSFEGLIAHQQTIQTFGRTREAIRDLRLGLLLLVAAGMLLSGFGSWVALNPGFRTDQLITMTTDTAFGRYATTQTRDFFRDVADRAQALPGVVSVALASSVPFDGNGSREAVSPEGYSFPQGVDRELVSLAVVNEGYFETMKTEIVRGRAFTADDRDDARRVAIVNEAFSMRYWPGQDPIGKRMRLNGSQGPWVEIVGLTRTGKYGFIGEPPTPFLYEPFAQNVRTQMSLVVETTSPDAASLAGPLREVVRAVDVNQPVFNVRTVSSLFEQRALGPPLMVARVATAIGVLGLSLALIGLYGLVAYSVARRTREIGLRIAMGAERSRVVSMVLRQGLTLSIAGIVVGGVLSLAVARLLMSAMSGLAAPSLAVSMLVPFMLIGLTLLASYVPARRAASVDPLRALRDE